MLFIKIMKTLFLNLVNFLRGGDDFMRYVYTPTGNKATDDLGHQFEKIMQKANRGSIATRYRYAAAGERFVKWVQPAFKMQKLANLKDKHLVGYVQHLKNSGCSDKYVKNELAALRYIHFITPNTKFELSDSKKFNQQAGLGSTRNEKAKEVDRAWTRRELTEMQKIAINKGRPEIARMMEATYNTGMRLEEAASLRRHEVEKALRTGQLHLRNTKGGRPRDIPLTDEASRVLKDAIQDVKRGDYVFCPSTEKVHEYKKDVEDLIYRNRDYIQDFDREESAVNCGGSEDVRSALNYHGLRYSYAQNLYEDLLREDKDDEEARKDVSKALGHGRIEITTVYLK